MMPKNSSPFNLALIGRHISHSKSPAYYRSQFNNLNKYDLIDVGTPSDLPSLIELSKKYKAVNITSPYKKNYFNQINLFRVPSEISAINLLLFKDKEVLGTNTDYLALLSLLPSYLGDRKSVVLLGNGVMSEIISLILPKFNIGLTHYSRSSHKNFSSYDFRSKYAENVLFINTCSRSFEFSGHFPDNARIFDVNYGETNFIQFLRNQKVDLIDGTELFANQAKISADLIRETLDLI